MLSRGFAYCHNSDGWKSTIATIVSTTIQSENPSKIPSFCSIYVPKVILISVPPLRPSSYPRYLFHTIRKSPFLVTSIAIPSSSSTPSSQPSDDPTSMLANAPTDKPYLDTIVSTITKAYSRSYCLAYSNIFFHLFDQIFCDIIITYLCARIGAFTGNR